MPCPAGSVLTVSSLSLATNVVPVIQGKVFDERIHFLHIRVDKILGMVFLIISLPFDLPLSSFDFNGQRSPIGIIVQFRSQFNLQISLQFL